ncbi:MAG: hypothetical protein K2I72_01560 [Bacilli bacterium]|nr:hypothetical protein [Bacilli bacterium]
MDERASMLNDYVSTAKENKGSFDIVVDYLSKLNSSLQGVQTVFQVKYQIVEFINTYEIPQEVIDVLSNACQELDSGSSVYEACSYIFELMQQMTEERENDAKKSEDELKEIQQNVTDHLENQLDEVGINIRGDYGELEEKIQTEEDVSRLKDNINRVVEYLKERQQVIGENNTEVSLSTEQVVASLEENGDETVLNAVLEEEEARLDQPINENVEIDQDGFIVVHANSQKEESMDFVKMMAIGLMTANSDSILSNANFGMIITKNQYNQSDFSIKFGNLSNQIGQNFSSDPQVMSKISELVNSFQTHVDYSSLLSTSSPEIALLFQLFEKYVLDKEGMAQITVQNGTGNLNISFGLDENYQGFAETLKTNGALFTETPTGDYVCNVTETMPGNALMILNSTNETMETLSENLENPELDKRKPYIKTIDSNQTGNVKPYLLIVAASLFVFIILFILWKF